MAQVALHIYDVTNGSERVNSAVVRINKIFHDGIGIGGIFHSAVQVYGDDEWSFGFCEEGSGVFSCASGKNTMYTYRKSFVLGKTNFDTLEVNQILRELSREWHGHLYDPLSKNCNHFCEEFCARLGVPKPPGKQIGGFILTVFMTAWVNRFANVADIAIEVAGNTASRFRQAKTEIISATKAACRFLFGVSDNVRTGEDSSSNSNKGESPRVQGGWFKNPSTNGAKSSSASATMNTI